MTLLARLRFMVLGWGSVGVAYTTGRLVSGAPGVLHETALDRLIPFDPAGIWLYLSFFLLVPLAFLTTEPNRVRSLARSMQLCALVSAIVFVLWPTTLVYPPIPAGAAGASVLGGLIASDSAQNCFPSLHGALTLLSVAALCARRKPVRSALAVLWGLGIGWSVIQTRRHLAIDLGAGVLLGCASGWLVAYLHRRRESPMAATSTNARANATFENTLESES
jgi:membrane-associated phospholipid phosphatase